MSQANVRSVDAIKDFKNALATFAEEAHTALTGVEMEIRQTRNWLERDQITYWKGQVKKSQEAVAEAKAELFRRKLSQGNSDAVSDAEQKENLRNAQRRLEQAERMVEKCKKMVPVLEHAIAEYHSQSQPLGDHIAGRLVLSLNLLERMIVAVEKYLATEVPMGPERETTGSSAGGSASKPKPASAAAGTPQDTETAAEAPAAEAAPSGDQPETRDGADAGAARPQEAAAG
jgi:hypothetical protein